MAAEHTKELMDHENIFHGSNISEIPINRL